MKDENTPFGTGAEPCSQPRRNYHTTEKEALGSSAMHEAVPDIHPGKQDSSIHRPPGPEAGATAPKPSGRVARWAAALMEYDFDIRHRPGAKNVLADSLSRDPALRTVTVEIGDRDVDDLLVDVKKYLCGHGGISDTTDWMESKRS